MTPNVQLSPYNCVKWLTYILASEKTPNFSYGDDSERRTREGVNPLTVRHVFRKVFTNKCSTVKLQLVAP
jgi:hypothetical protein